MNRARVPSRRENIEVRFRSLVESWKRDTAILSSTPRKIAHPAYRKIVGMGWAVVPLLLRELEADPDHWFWALTEITGEDPVPAGHRGKLEEMTGDWLEFAREKHYF
jgi:hypothetical protein